MYDLVRIPLPLLKSSVGAVRKVSPNWSQDTMTCHSSNCFVWGKGNVPLLNPDKTKVSVSDMFKVACGVSTSSVAEGLFKPTSYCLHF